MNAVEQGMKMMSIPIKDLPLEAFKFAKWSARRYGMCGEVLLTAYIVYAQIVLGLPCDDDLYFATPGVRADWDTAQKETL